MLFDYFYGVEADLYNFIRLPKMLMTQKEYCDISIESKLLYGLLLDRMSSVGKNKWIDEEERVYVIFPLSEIQKMMGISKKKAMADLSELEEHGLIVRKHRGYRLPDVIYLMNLAV